MRKLTIVFCIMMIVLGVGHAQEHPFEGRWWLGMIEEASLPINLTFENGKPVLYSPMQSSEPMPATKWSFSGDTLRLAESRTGVKLVLLWNGADSTFSGTFRQGLLRSDMTFEPSNGLFKPVRPQTPQEPFPYSEEEVTVVRKKAGVTLVGTLTVPDGAGPFPAVVLVSGSGQQNRDEELLGHRPFLVLADYLSRHGIAVLRYDDRAAGKSTGDVANATTLDFADDAEAVFDFLCKQKKIDRRRVGIVGHSEGGMIAPIVASRNKRVAFIVTLGGPGTSGAEILLQQNELIMKLDGVGDDLVGRHLEVLREFFDMTDTLPVDSYQSMLVALCEKRSEGLSAEQRKQAALRKGDAIAIATQMRIPWMRTFIALNNSLYLSKVRCPMLALNGEKDCQVPPQNLDLIKKATGGRAETRLMPGLNHLMQHCTTGSAREYMLIEETMAVEVLETISKWILDL